VAEAEFMQAIAEQGPFVVMLGGVLFWFMKRVEKLLDRLAKSLTLIAESNIRLLDHYGSIEAKRLREDLQNLNGD